MLFERDVIETVPNLSDCRFNSFEFVFLLSNSSLKCFAVSATKFAELVIIGSNDSVNLNSIVSYAELVLQCHDT